MILQIVPIKEDKFSQRRLREALAYIGEKDPKTKKFTRRARELQKLYHSSISIFKKLRRVRNIVHKDPPH